MGEVKKNVFSVIFFTKNLGCLKYKAYICSWKGVECTFEELPPYKYKSFMPMMKKLLILTLCAGLFTATTELRAQDISKTAIENEQAPITISVSESTVHIKNADKKIVSIFNLTGVEVKRISIDSPSKTIDLSFLPKGCYIIKIGNVARKVYLR